MQGVVDTSARIFTVTAFFSFEIKSVQSHIHFLKERTNVLGADVETQKLINKKETTIERGNPLCSDDPEIPEWLQEFRENFGG